MKKLASILIILALIVLNITAFAQSNPAPNLQSITRSDSGVYAAVGDAGFIVSSSDGVSWSKRTSPIQEKLNGVVWGLGMFVAVGDNGTILTSADGTEWKKAELEVKVDLCGAASNGKEFVVAGNDGVILISKDGQKWQQTRMATSESIYRVRWLNGRYIAVGAGMLILTSEDGITWEQEKAEPDSTTMFTDVTWNGSKYIVVGDHLNVWVSGDGVKWNDNEGNYPINNLEGTDSADCIYSIIWAENKLLAVANRGNVFTLPYGGKWQKEANVTRKWLKDVVYSKDKFVAVGDEGIILNSDDGINWSNLNSLSLQSDEINLEVGVSKKLEVSLNHPYGDSSDVTGNTTFEVIEGDDIVTVENNGMIKAVKEGQARIRATYDFKSTEVLVNIEPLANTATEKPQSTSEESSKQENNNTPVLYILLALGGIAVAALITIIYKGKNKGKG